MWSQLKLLKHKDIVKNIVNNNVSIPTHIQFEFTESCNFSCVFCPWHGDEKENNFKNIDFNGKRFFDYKRFIELVDELEEIGVKAISITGAGENLIHPQFDKFIYKLANSKIEFALTSNFGVKIKEETLKNLLKAKWLRWSVNASDEDTYNKTNRPKVKNAYEISKNNILKLIELRTDEKVHVGASFVIGDYNKHNIVNIAHFVKLLGVDSISFRPDTPLFRNEKSFHYDDYVKDMLIRVTSHESDNFKIFINYGRLMDSVKIDDETLKCYYSNHSIHIISNGDVYPCCMTRYNKDYRFGNLMNQSFKEFWFSNDRINNYKKINMINCPSCHHTDINKVLKYFYEEGTIDNFI